MQKVLLLRDKCVHDSRGCHLAGHFSASHEGTFNSRSSIFTPCSRDFPLDFHFLETRHQSRLKSDQYATNSASAFAPRYMHRLLSLVGSLCISCFTYFTVSHSLRLFSYHRCFGMVVKRYPDLSPDLEIR